MTDKEFKDVIKSSINHINTTLKTKGEEYARGDRLSNFKRAGELARSSPEMALRGMLSKHIISIYDMIEDTEDEGVISAEDLWKWCEKIGDAINYLILLKALIYERFDNQG